MYKIICYKSKVKSTLNTLDLVQLFDFSRDTNTKNGISGFLLKKEETFFQIIEGNDIVIDSLYKNIQKDDRHINIDELVNMTIKQKIFGNFFTEYNTIEESNILYALQEYVELLKNSNHKNSDLFSKIIQDFISA